MRSLALTLVLAACGGLSPQVTEPSAPSTPEAAYPAPESAAEPAPEPAPAPAPQPVTPAPAEATPAPESGELIARFDGCMMGGLTGEGEEIGICPGGMLISFLAQRTGDPDAAAVVTDLPADAGTFHRQAVAVRGGVRAKATCRGDDTPERRAWCKSALAQLLASGMPDLEP